MATPFWYHSHTSLACLSSCLYILIPSVCLRGELNKHKIFSQLLLGILDLITLLVFQEMQPTMSYMRLAIISISFTTFSILCDARIFAQFLKSQDTELEKKLKAINHLELDLPLPSPNVKPLEVSPPFYFPPFDSLAPLPLPGNVPLPPYCANPPFSQNPPQPNTPSSSSSPSSSAPTCSPIPKPPPANGPTPHPPGPPTTIPSPPKNPLSPPPKPVSGPPALAPPVAYPPPSGPPQKKPPQSGAVWCVAKPAVPGPIVQEALDYACGSGADCKSIQPNGSCYKPDTLLSHASYAFNSYWQSTKAAGGTCDFGGTAMIVTVDPNIGNRVVGKKIIKVLMDAISSTMDDSSIDQKNLIATLRK